MRDMTATTSDPTGDVFRALADRTRRQILLSLQAEPRAVHAIASEFEISRPAISRHLRVLKSAALVRERPQGREIYYAMNPAPLRAVRNWLDQFWAGRLVELKTIAEGERS
jgi:DNA-binding transcriptional ArsR family regulator